MGIELADLVVLVFAVLLLAAAWSDLTRFIIPNSLVIALLVLYPGHAVASGLALADIAMALAIAGVVFAAGFVMFAAGWLGGGDVKLLAATLIWAGPLWAVPALFIMAGVGGALAMIYSLPLGGLLPAPPVALFKAGLRPARARQCMPYGLAIAAAGLFVATRLLGL